MDFNRLKYHFDKAGVTPSTVLDIGAYNGSWCKEFKNLYPDAIVHQFEGNKSMTDKLEGVFDIVLLGDKYCEDIKYYKGGNQTGNSIFKENTVYYEDCEVEYLTMHTLDDVLGGRYEKIDLLKADIQGNEINMLKGATDTLTKVDLILLEVSLLQYNSGSPLCAEVFSFMDSIEFMAIDILEKHYFGDVMIQMDVLFARKESVYVTKTFN